MFELYAAAAVFVLVVLVTRSALVTLPIGLLLAMYALTADAPLMQAAAIGALASATAWWLVALAARGASGAGLGPQHDQLRGFLAGSRTYWYTTLWAASTPVIPPRFLFPLLGSMRAPLRYALLGKFLGQVPILLLTTWISVAIARAVTDDDQQAATLVGVFAILLLVRRLVDAVDWPYFREHRRLRVREAVRMRDQNPLPGATRIFSADDLFGATRSRPAADLDDDEVLDLEAVAEPEDHSRDSGSNGSAPPTLPSGS